VQNDFCNTIHLTTDIDGRPLPNVEKGHFRPTRDQRHIALRRLCTQKRKSQRDFFFVAALKSPNQAAHSKYAQNSKPRRHALDGAGVVKSPAKVVSEREDLRSRSARTGLSFSPRENRVTVTTQDTLNQQETLKEQRLGVWQPGAGENCFLVN
jgi:hypothetical protein